MCVILGAAGNIGSGVGLALSAAELKTTRSIADALLDSGLEKMVLASTYGAQQGGGIGDLLML